MYNIPDAPWVRDPETYANIWYGGSIYIDDDEEEVTE